MIRHSRRAWHLDKIAHSVAGSEVLRGWLPVIAVEILLFVTFLLWLLHNGSEYHGFAVVYAWTIYCLTALALVFFWSGPAEKQSARDQDRSGPDRD
jgi:hypothetical protein